ncbi:MAG: restriction endonuclease [Cyanobacteria bacterium]|nr:restriction endonuclease [Cyanobacteriota bacterium]
MNELPKYNELMLPVLKILEAKGAQINHELRDALIATLQISEELLEERLPSGNARVLDNRIGWATTYLAKAGLITRPRRAIVEITDKGRGLLKEDPSGIDLAILKRYEGFREFQGRTKDDQSGEEISGNDSVGTTPEEQIEKGILQIKRDLQDEVLQRVKQLPPEGFEQLVLRLLVGMGYGGSMADVQGVARGSDGGVDGVVNQDHLGLDQIYIQAKRWEGSVGRPVIQGFVGALAGVGASKGVIMTTSTFAQPAQEYVRTLTDRRIILVDGQMMSELMLKYGIGVSTKQTFVIQRMDEDFFLEMES